MNKKSKRPTKFGPRPNRLSECLWRLSDGLLYVYEADLSKISTAWGRRTFIELGLSPCGALVEYYLHDKRLKHHTGSCVRLTNQNALSIIAQLQLVQYTVQGPCPQSQTVIYCNKYLSTLLPLEYALNEAKRYLREFKATYKGN